MKTTKVLAGITVAVLSVSASMAQEGYFTTYGHEIEKGETELMLMIDHNSPSTPRRKEGQRNYLSQMPKIGYNPTDQLEVEFMVENFQEFGTGISKFTGFRFETRYRLFKKEVFLNPTIYFEFENLDPATRFKMETSGWILPPYKQEEEQEGQEAQREKIIESRFILSQNIGNWNIAANWLNESDTRSGETAFGYSVGAMYKLFYHEGATGPYRCTMHPDIVSDKPGECSKCGMKLKGGSSEKKFLRPAVLTFEFFGGLGDNKKLAFNPKRQEHYFQPSIMLHFRNDFMLSTGFAFGLSDASDNMSRIMLMKMF